MQKNNTMIHILKSKSGYRVRYTGRNGEILATSEVLTSKQNAWKNVRAMGKVFAAFRYRGFVKDETTGIWWALWVNHETGKSHKRKMAHWEITDVKKKYKIK